MMLHVNVSENGLGWSVGLERGRKLINVYRSGKVVFVDVDTNWGKVHFFRAYTKHGWGPWKDTRPGASARRFADRYSIAEFMKVLSGLHDDPTQAVVEVCILQAKIEADERERLDALVALYIKNLKRNTSKIRKMGWQRISKQWLERLAQGKTSKLLKRLDAKELSESDAERALAFALDEFTFRGIEIYDAA